MAKPKFIVTGCSRSGTTYMSVLLSELGLVCGHERVFNIFPVTELAPPFDYEKMFGDKDGDSSFLAVPYIKDLPEGTVVLHQVRHPVHVIRSHMGIRYFAADYQPTMYLADNHPDFLNFIGRHCPEIFSDEDELRRTMRYWVQWNKMAEEGATASNVRYLRYRVEALDLRLLEQIIELLQIRVSALKTSQALASISRSTNARLRDDAISWDALPEGRLKSDIAKLAAEYGYGDLHAMSSSVPASSSH
jgi:hypothetical protein